MNIKWLAGAKTADEKKSREDVVANSRALLTLLAKVLQHEIDLLGQPLPVDEYENSGWAFKEADRKGQIRALKNVLSLCDHQTGVVNG